MEPIDSYMAVIGDYEVYVNDMACISMEMKQYRFPRSKKVRIRKKWAKKRFNNFRLTAVEKCIIIGRKMYLSSAMYKKFIESLPQAPPKKTSPYIDELMDCFKTESNRLIAVMKGSAIGQSAIFLNNIA